jgi:hypothetical protein
MSSLKSRRRSLAFGMSPRSPEGFAGGRWGEPSTAFRGDHSLLGFATRCARTCRLLRRASRRCRRASPGTMGEPADCTRPGLVRGRTAALALHAAAARTWLVSVRYPRPRRLGWRLPHGHAQRPQIGIFCSYDRRMGCDFKWAADDPHCRVQRLSSGAQAASVSGWLITAAGSFGQTA